MWQTQHDMGDIKHGGPKKQNPSLLRHALPRKRPSVSPFRWLRTWRFGQNCKKSGGFTPSMAWSLHILHMTTTWSFHSWTARVLARVTHVQPFNSWVVAYNLFCVMWTDAPWARSKDPLINRERRVPQGVAHETFQSSWRGVNGALLGTHGQIEVRTLHWLETEHVNLPCISTFDGDFRYECSLHNSKPRVSYKLETLPATNMFPIGCTKNDIYIYTYFHQ